MNLTNQRRTLVLKAYLSRCSQEKMALLERFLPQESYSFANVINAASRFHRVNQRRLSF